MIESALPVSVQPKLRKTSKQVGHRAIKTRQGRRFVVIRGAPRENKGFPAWGSHSLLFKWLFPFRVGRCDCIIGMVFLWTTFGIWIYAVLLADLDAVHTKRVSRFVSNALPGHFAEREVIVSFPGKIGIYSVHPPKKSNQLNEKRASPNYNRLKIKFRKRRRIIRSYENETEVAAADDDDVEEDEEEDAEYDFPEDIGCRPTLIQRRYHRPICNSFQELGMDHVIRTGFARALGSGDINNAFLVEQTKGSYLEKKFVVKGIAIEEGYTLADYDWWLVRKDATISAAAGSLFPHRIVRSYGFCGLTEMVEFQGGGVLGKVALPDGTLCQKTKQPDVDLTTVMDKPLVMRNNLTVAQKLQFSLDMAESLAALHNHPEGSIVHGDVWLDQFLVDETGERLKLNDFNCADVMDFNEDKQEYCNYRAYKDATDYGAAPEDFNFGKSGTERDIYRLGLNMYSVLTGFDLYPQTCDAEEKYELLRQDKRSFLDPRWGERSYGERQMYRIIQSCWQTNPSDRPTVGEVIQKLRDALFFKER